MFVSRRGVMATISPSWIGGIQRRGVCWMRTQTLRSSNPVSPLPEKPVENAGPAEEMAAAEMDYYDAGQPLSLLQKEERRSSGLLGSFYETFTRPTATQPVGTFAQLVLAMSANAHVYIGHAWTVELLRGKDWTDLHRLWYILLRERNMLKTKRYEIGIKRASMQPRVFSERVRKVRLSMKNIKLVIAERYRAWLDAHDLWSLHLQGKDIRDPMVLAEWEQKRRQEKWKRLLRRKGRYIGHLLYPVKQRLIRKGLLPADPPKSADLLLKPFHVTPAKGRYSRDRFDLDMTPVQNRRHRSRRTVSKFGSRKIVFPTPN